MSKYKDDIYHYEEKPRLVLDNGQELVAWPPSIKGGDFVWVEPGHTREKHRLIKTDEIPGRKRIRWVTVVRKKQGTS